MLRPDLVMEDRTVNKHTASEAHINLCARMDALEALRLSGGKSLHDHLLQLINDLKTAGVRTLLLDWDGCMTPCSGLWHGAVAAEAFNAIPSFAPYGPCTREEAADAYLGPGHGIDWFALFAQNLVAQKIDVPSHIPKIMEEFRFALLRVAEAFAAGALAPEIEVTPNPGVELFLSEAQRNGIDRHVVTMTPLALVEALAQRAGLDGYLDSFVGCEAFEGFAHGKADPRLWISAAKLYGREIREVAIVEDSPRSVRGALLSGARAIIEMKGSLAEQLEQAHPESLLWSTATKGDLFTVTKVLLPVGPAKEVRRL